MTTIKIKKGAGTPSGLTFGELAYDVTNRKLFIGITGSNALLANTDGGVATFNGLTGAVSGVTVGGTNVFTALNTFNAGLSGNINISTTNAQGNVMYLLMARGTGVTGVFIDNVTTPLIYNPFLGNLGLKGLTLSSGSDSLSILPGQVTANNSTNDAYFYFIANGGNYFQSPVLSQIGDIGAVNSAMTLNVDPSTRVMTWGDGVLLTGVTSGFFGVNRSPYGMLSDYAVEINSPAGKGIQLMYNDYTGAVSNSVKMDVSSAGNYTVLPSGGLATITGTLNVSAGISAAGATFSGNVAMTSTSSYTGLASFSGGLSAAGGVTFNTSIQTTRLPRLSSSVFEAKTANWTPTNADDGKIFTVSIGGKSTITCTLNGLSPGVHFKILLLAGNITFSVTGTGNGNAITFGLSAPSSTTVYCTATDTYFATNSA